MVVCFCNYSMSVNFKYILCKKWKLSMLFYWKKYASPNIRWQKSLSLCDSVTSLHSHPPQWALCLMYRRPVKIHHRTNISHRASALAVTETGFPCSLAAGRMNNAADAASCHICIELSLVLEKDAVVLISFIRHVRCQGRSGLDFPSPHNKPLWI